MSYYMRALHPNLIYLDTIGGLPLIECYDSRHSLTRSQSKEARLNIMRQVTNAGAVLGAEGPPQDWNVKVADFYDEGVLALTCRYGHSSITIVLCSTASMPLPTIMAWTTTASSAAAPGR
jgi:hypothetical protein